MQDGQHGRGAAKKLVSATSGGDVLVVTGSGTEVIVQFVVSSTEPSGVAQVHWRKPLQNRVYNGTLGSGFGQKFHLANDQY